MDSLVTQISVVIAATLVVAGIAYRLQDASKKKRSIAKERINKAIQHSFKAKSDVNYQTDKHKQCEKTNAQLQELGLEPGRLYTRREIKTAYLIKMKKYHPDHLYGANNSELQHARLKISDIQRAYKYLNGNFK
ncbi:hypothetical protein BOO92_18375 [Vibrio navarrensis]|uniref:DnaJ domain-containing protein n=1 Tax=Vibrio navarrensis TaxID=29495 RepID=UPI001868D68B|nr:J domain-containing protein [Vibrio navarrensis]MBE3658640.1 hypothetical protein [Vibrio navarrensis]